MQPLRFDIALVGDSLAARMAAALLAKYGKRLLLFTSPAQQDAWQNSSLFVEHLLDILGGRDILSANQPFQVLSNRARVTIHPAIPLNDELTREFGKDATAVAKLLDEFERTGNQLEELLWEYGGLPTAGLREAAAWRWLCLRRRLPLLQLNGSLTEHLQGFPEYVTEWLRDLFQGLSLQLLKALTVADGALLWSQARRSTGLAADALNDLLSRRFEQFHGVEVPAETLIGVEYSHGHWICSLEGGKRFQAGHLVLGDMGYHLPGLSHKASRSLPPSRHIRATITDGRISALFEKRVVIGGPLPLRLDLSSTLDDSAISIGTAATANETGIRGQLDPLLPFARYTLETMEPPHHESSEATGAASLLKCPLHLGNHLWCADTAFLLPQLGNGGAAPVAWTLARQLDPTLTNQIGSRG